MDSRQKAVALAGAAVGLGAGLAVQHSWIKRRRRDDPEAAEDFGERRGVRARTIEVSDGARIFVEEAGPSSNRGIVFIHGSSLRTDVWHYQLPGIDGRRLVFYDLRGHGRSQPKGDAPFLIATLADDLQRVIDDAGLDEVVLVGHSIGGMIALEFASTRPDLLGSKVKGLVLENATYRPAAETMIGGEAIARIERVIRRPLDALGSQHRRLERFRKLVRPSDAVFLAVAVSSFGPGASAKQIDFTYDLVSETPIDVIFDLIKSYRDFDVTDRLGDVTVPVLVVGGTHDRLTVPSASEYLAENLPKAELRMLEGCGHMSMLERHGEINRLIGAFADDVLGTDKRQPKRRTKAARS